LEETKVLLLIIQKELSTHFSMMGAVTVCVFLWVQD